MAVIEKLWKGKYISIRAVYFKERSDARIREIEEIINDVEYLTMELQRLERRACYPCLVATELRNFLIQLTYWEMRRKSKKDNPIIKLLAQRYFIDPIPVRAIIMNENILDSWFWNETEAGKELDHYIPFKDTLIKPTRFLMNKKNLTLHTRKELMEYISVLCSRYDRILVSKGKQLNKI